MVFRWARLRWVLTLFAATRVARAAYVEGPKVGNLAFREYCSPGISSLEDAAAACDHQTGCRVLHSYDCHPDFWRPCAASLRDLQAGGLSSDGARACTMVPGTTSVTSTVTATPVSTTATPWSFADGPPASNGAYLGHCSPTFGTRQEAQALCEADPDCTLLHSYDCLSWAWRHCTGRPEDLLAAAADARACTQIPVHLMTSTLTSSGTSSTTATATSSTLTTGSTSASSTSASSTSASSTSASSTITDTVTATTFTITSSSTSSTSGTTSATSLTTSSTTAASATSLTTATSTATSATTTETTATTITSTATVSTTSVSTATSTATSESTRTTITSTTTTSTTSASTASHTATSESSATAIASETVTSASSASTATSTVTSATTTWTTAISITSTTALTTTLTTATATTFTHSATSTSLTSSTATSSASATTTLTSVSVTSTTSSTSRTDTPPLSETLTTPSQSTTATTDTVSSVTGTATDLPSLTQTSATTQSNTSLASAADTSYAAESQTSTTRTPVHIGHFATHTSTEPIGVADSSSTLVTTWGATTAASALASTSSAGFGSTVTATSERSGATAPAQSSTTTLTSHSLLRSTAAAAGAQPAAPQPTAGVLEGRLRLLVSAAELFAADARASEAVREALAVLMEAPAEDVAVRLDVVSSRRSSAAVGEVRAAFRLETAPARAARAASVLSDADAAEVAGSLLHGVLDEAGIQEYGVVRVAGISLDAVPGTPRSSAVSGPLADDGREGGARAAGASAGLLVAAVASAIVLTISVACSTMLLVRLLRHRKGAGREGRAASGPAADEEGMQPGPLSDVMKDALASPVNPSKRSSDDSFFRRSSPRSVSTQLQTSLFGLQVDSAAQPVAASPWPEVGPPRHPLAFDLPAALEELLDAIAKAKADKKAMEDALAADQAVPDERSPTMRSSNITSL